MENLIQTPLGMANHCLLTHTHTHTFLGDLAYLLPLYEVPRIVKFRETKNGIGVAEGWGSWCFLGTEFHLEKKKKFWRYTVVMCV